MKETNLPIEPKAVTQILRAYPEQTQTRKKRSSKPEKKTAQKLSAQAQSLKNTQLAIAENFRPYSDFVFVFDCETTADVKNELRFGFASVFGIERSEQVDLWESRQLTREQLDKPHRHFCFYHLKHLNPDELALLTAWVDRFNCEKEENQPPMVLLPVAKFIKQEFYYWVHKKRALCVGHNLPFDLSRLATDWGPGGKDYTNGFKFILCDCIKQWQARNPQKRDDLQPDDCQFHRKPSTPPPTHTLSLMFQ